MTDPAFQTRIASALNDTRLRAALRGAMDGLMEKRAKQFSDTERWTRLREQGAAVRRRALADLPNLLERLEARCAENGITVHWAEDPAEACRLVAAILKDGDAKLVVKGKSMVSEEMHLNAHLEGEGIEILESDLGEYIIQLAGETPSHIVMPCIHKNRQDIAQLFKDRIAGAPYTEEVGELTALARAELREKFRTAQAGISGVNMAVAETGTLVLVENEGNGRMSTTVPPLHIAVMGIEKVVPTLADVAPILGLLAPSATGQHATTYVNMISGPRKEGDRDGPTAVHLILLDNNRTASYADSQLRDTLRCIRCGACMNHCPVYTRIGGHAYGTVYPGPIGKILMPQQQGLEARGDLPSASSLCNACVEVCPVKIPIASILVRLRAEACQRDPNSPVKGAGAKSSAVESLIWRGWAAVHASGPLYRLTGWLATRFRWAIPSFLPPISRWTRHRVTPRPAARTLHELARERGIADE